MQANQVATNCVEKMERVFRHVLNMVRVCGLLTVAGTLISAKSSHAELSAQQPASSVALDSDHDGISDALEQALLERFLPHFQISATDCAVRPAEFAADLKVPKSLHRDGTIYGQVMPRSDLPTVKGAVVEAHFYDLWDRDCGRMGHALDAEHVAVLLHAPRMDSPIAEWTAAYWFAAAHEATVCDASQIAAAKSLDAETHGAAVWISAGKHGAFLSQAICTQGCGDDTCPQMKPLDVPRVVNLGEPGMPMNGAMWVNASTWPLAQKMKPEFTEAGIKLIAAGEGTPVQLNGAKPAVKGTIYVANETYNGIAVSFTNTGNALSTANEKTGTALSSANDKTGNALDKSADNVGHAMGKSTKAVGRFLGKAVGKKPENDVQ